MYIEPNMQSSSGFAENMAVNYMAGKMGNMTGEQAAGTCSKR